MKVKEKPPDLQVALAYGKTADYRQDMKDRAVFEGKHSEAVRYHGGRRTPCVGIDRVFLGEAIRCADLNLKRFFKLPERQMNPAWGKGKDQGVAPFTWPHPYSKFPKFLIAKLTLLCFARCHPFAIVTIGWDEAFRFRLLV